MKAMVLDQIAPVSETPLRLREMPELEPQAGEVRVKVRCCGVCRTDLHVIEGDLPRHKLPVICGIWPLTSYRNAEFMVNELRVPVPEIFMDRMRRVDNAEKAREEGVAIAREMVARVSKMVQGVQLSAPFGRYQMAIDVAEAIEPR